jgi:tetratricopeptide (TPR) repeat protein
VLYNLARLYLLDSAYQKGIPIARQLIQVDPSNPDNFQLLGIAYAAIQKDYQAKAKAAEARAKALGDRANAKGATATVQKAVIDTVTKVVNPLIKAYGDSAARAVDSALKYTDMMTKLPAKVSFTEFTPSDAKTTLGGTVTNNTDAARSFTLKIEFIDKGGNVVATQNVEVGPVQPKSSATFQTTGTGAGIIAFRYAPIT